MDGMRAIAALSVLTTHAAIVSGAINQAHWGNIVNRLEIGVALFFLLSGFLLYRPFVASRYDGRPRPRLRKYARRRALRIVPAYWFALTMLTILLSLPGVFTHDWWVYYGFAQIYRPEWVLGGIKPAWSLCVEELLPHAPPVRDRAGPLAARARAAAAAAPGAGGPRCAGRPLAGLALGAA